MTNKPQVFMLPFAGGSRFSFEYMRKHMTFADMECLELPGRGLRLDEPLCTDPDAIATELCNTIFAKLRSKRYVIYGHSLGALLGLKVTAIMEQRLQPPVSLVVTGSCGPREDHYKQQHLQSIAALKHTLRKLGGIPDEVLEDEELFSFFEPIIKADFEVYGNCKPPLFAPVDTPVIAIMGEGEEHVDKLLNWRHYAAGTLVTQTFPGHHFFVLDYAKEVADAISSRLNPALTV